MNPSLREQQTRFAMLLQERGPKITEIARELGVYPETARYWFNHNIMGHRGVAYQAVPNYEGLGFKRILVVVDLGNEYSPHAKAILVAMNRLCYLTHYFRLFPSGYYYLLLSVPSRIARHYEKLLTDLQDVGIFRILQLDQLDRIRVTPMKAKYFDFSKGKWDFDWSAIVNEKATVSPEPTRNGQIKYDYEDLRILEKLQADATRSVREVSRALKMPYQQGYNHFSHITERGQISLYCLRWPATGPRDQEGLKAWQQHHAHMALDFLVRNSTESERREILSRLERLPFNWSNGGGNGNLYSEFVIPLEYYSEAFQYLSEVLFDSRGRTEFTIGDQANALSFSIPAHLYDEEADAWTDSADDVLARFKKLVLTVKGKE